VAPATLLAPAEIGPVGWPERSIFFDVASWCYDYLRQPDGPDAGQPWEFTNQQARILAWWFAHDDDGRWLHRRGTVRMCKGWG
jgi:hypothetical protein